MTNNAEIRGAKIIKESGIKLPKPPKLKEGQWYLPPYRIIINRETYRGKGRPRYCDYKKESIKKVYYKPLFEDVKFKKISNGWKYTDKMKIKLKKTTYRNLWKI